MALQEVLALHLGHHSNQLPLECLEKKRKPFLENLKQRLS
jgi:hypothetical protein